MKQNRGGERAKQRCDLRQVLFLALFIEEWFWSINHTTELFSLEDRGQISIPIGCSRALGCLEEVGVYNSWVWWLPLTMGNKGETCEPLTANTQSN